MAKGEFLLKRMLMRRFLPKYMYTMCIYLGNGKIVTAELFRGIQTRLPRGAKLVWVQFFDGTSSIWKKIRRLVNAFGSGGKAY